MRAITHCPNCDTQFFVNEAQLNKHNGLVRCGQCLEVFDAKAQFVDSNMQPANDTNQQTIAPNHVDSPPIEQGSNQSTSDWPAIDNALLHDDDAPNAQRPHQDHPEAQATVTAELSASSEEIAAFAKETLLPDPSVTASSPRSENDDLIVIEDEDFINSIDEQNSNEEKHLNDITKLTMLADHRSDYFDDLSKLAKQNNTKRNYRWLWALGVVILLISAGLQSVYFLRNKIAVYFPSAKPHLVQACEYFSCRIDLPKQIEWIIIDDSDMQEDPNQTGVMHLSSSLMNKAPFSQAYPNLELTLTDINDNAVLRRIFKPDEYLPANTNIASGISGGQEIRIKLGITAENSDIAGYRLYVSY